MGEFCPYMAFCTVPYKKYLQLYPVDDYSAGLFCVHFTLLPFASLSFLKFQIFQKGQNIMEVSIKIGGRTVSVEVSIEVYEYLDQVKHKNENLAHEKRRHWDMRGFDEYIVVHECSRCYYQTPEQWLCRKETLLEIMTVLEGCTEVQRQRFFLFALDGLSYSEIGKLGGCSKYAVRDSIEAVRKKCRDFFENGPTKRNFQANK
jgi:predicted DNA-binding protein YlxM (UPF0122 family)